MLIDFTERRRVKERERNIGMRNINLLHSHVQPKYAPSWPGIKPQTFGVCSNQLSHTSQATFIFEEYCAEYRIENLQDNGPRIKVAIGASICFQYSFFLGFLGPYFLPQVVSTELSSLSYISRMEILVCHQLFHSIWILISSLIFDFIYNIVNCCDTSIKI